jgi:hypothetical protein
MKKTKNIISLVLVLFIFGCIKPVDIIIPDSMRTIPAMSVVGTEDSWKLDFGNFHAYNIQNTNSRIFLTDARNSSYDIKSFEFFLETPGNMQYQCYCEFPMKALDDEIFRCMFQNSYNQFDTGELNDRLVASSSGNIKIEGYYKHVESKPGSKKAIVGYLFTDSGNQVGLVDVSNTNSETVWINPELDMHKQIMIAASASSLILKHRKWYEAFYEKADSAIEHQY